MGTQVVWACGLNDPDEGSFSYGWTVTAGLPSVWRKAPHGSSALYQLPLALVSYLFKISNQQAEGEVACNAMKRLYCMQCIEACNAEIIKIQVDKSKQCVNQDIPGVRVVTEGREGNEEQHDLFKTKMNTSKKTSK